MGTDEIVKKFKKGDRVRVWSLQSFNNGGFLNGEPAIVRQTQSGDSVILCVVRNFEGAYKLDKSYEVYAKQCEIINYEPRSGNGYKEALEEMEDYRKELIKDYTIS